MIRLILLGCCISLSLLSSGHTIIVKNIDELNAANRSARPGDLIILQNGEWKDVNIKLNCSGTKEKPITFRAQTAGKVLITGKSKLKLGGSFIIIDGLYFKNGYAGDDAVINFRIDDQQLANRCRVTNTVVNDFNNPKRMDENYWVAFYGKNNRLDHCSFVAKKNMGVLLAVILDDDRSRENFHSIDHNYFGSRPPLGSNGGEIIRVGVSQHCQFNSNTEIKDNFFEYCDGETEVVSIKSCSNKVEANVFKECQGSVVLRHGDNNLVAGNYFLGNDKPGSGGVRVINKGQKVVNNVFYKCRGVDFRSPLAIMNGIPNSPAHRYVQVIDAEIRDNIFYECSPITLCEGSDTERTLPPKDVIISGNTFYNTRDSIIYKVYDDIKDISFADNKVSKNINQDLTNGFIKTQITKPAVDKIVPLKNEIVKNSGAGWFAKSSPPGNKKLLAVNCATAAEIYKQLATKDPMIIRLTGTAYSFDKPVVVSKYARFTGSKGTIIKFSSEKMLSVFVIAGNGGLILDGLTINGENVNAAHFISSDSTGSSDHYNLSIESCTIERFKRGRGCLAIFHAYRSMIADSIIIRESSFIDNDCDFINMPDEKDDKGYYNAEKIFIGHNKFIDQSGTLLNIYRGGNDESTLGPQLIFSHNKINNCSTGSNSPLMSLTGVQVTEIFSNNFSNCNSSATLIFYRDIVRARHSFEKNILLNSGKFEKNAFVTERNNTIK